MTDCNACIVGSEPDGMCEVFERTNVKKSRKEYKCCECGAVIPIGSPYESTFTVYEGDAQRYRTCIFCVEIRETYYCNDGVYQPLIGELWNDVDESDLFRSFNTVCLSKLKTPGAKAFMLAKWQKWKGLSA